MSGAVKAVKKVAKKTIKLVTDPLGLTDTHQPQAPIVVDSAMDETEQASIAAETAQEEAARRSKKKKETTQTVLTSPLGSTNTAQTAVKKLGGGFGL